MAKLQDVANLAGVSRSSASKILNERWDGRTSFSPQCVARVRAAAAELGYTGSYLGRGLRAGRSHALGMFCWRSEGDAVALHPFLARMVAGVDDVARGRGYQVLLAGASPEEDGKEEAVRLLATGRLDALIVPDWLIWGWSDELKGCGRPVVAMGRAERYGLPYAALDDAAGIRAIVGHLADLGHRRLLWVGGPPEGSSWSHRRRAAFRMAVAERGLQASECAVVDAPWDEAARSAWRGGAREAILGQVRREGEDFTAVVCASEYVAWGAYEAAAELGRRIPQDWSVTGFDDCWAHLAIPPMTVGSHMLEEIGREAARLAIGLIEDESFEPEPVIVKSELVVRRSTAPPGVRGGA
jgi:LacI family transcriptional regulator